MPIRLLLFAGVMLCGVGIRLLLVGHFRAWAIMEREGPGDAANAGIRQTYVRATGVLVVLWLFIAAIVFVSVLRPAS